MAEAAFKAPGGLIRATVRLVSGIVDDAAFTGDFTLLPAAALDALGAGVRGLPLDRAALTARLGELYTAHAIRSPGVTPEHFAEALMLCAANPNRFRLCFDGSAKPCPDQSRYALPWTQSRMNNDAQP